MKSRFQIPRATYRLQLNRDFTFVQAKAIVPYLAALGISHCYISPCLKARPGSMHGYDIVDHNAFNPEIGTAEEFDAFVSTLHEHDMGLILDIVPNHMGVMGEDNAWWLAVLENGEASAYANFFDIDWRPLKDELHGKVLVPVLHDHYGAVLESGELKLVFHQERGEFYISYRNHRFPVNPREYPRILQRCTDKLTVRLGVENPDLLEFQSLITAFGHLPRRQEVDTDLIIERNRDKEIHKRRLAALAERSQEVADCVVEGVNAINGNKADPASFDEMHELIKVQAFRLANWRVASDDINYRRFFDTNDLAGLRMESEEVFEATHRLILQLVADGKVNGLRIDHPDGLYDPAKYFERLQRAIAGGDKKADSDKGSPYVVIEKILTGSEQLPASWPVSGTTGYDFASLVNGIFVDAENAVRVNRIYEGFTGQEIDFDVLAYLCRKLIIQVALASELNVLASQLTRIALSKRHTCDFTLNSLREALTEVVASFPVYRTYVSPSGVSETDARYINAAVELAGLRSPAADNSVFAFIREVLLTSIAEGHDAAYRNTVTAFAMKFQQFTSPVMAKGLEDTAFYRYNRLVSLNDVGNDLHRFGVTTSEFHVANQQRLRRWPHTMLATSTHDSKRAEDVRARINVLSEISAQWKLHLRDWKKFNSKHKKLVNGRPAPSANDEYLLYQTLVGAWPLEPLSAPDDWKIFSERIEGYMLKAIREAKENTSWINRNAAYEGAVFSFIRALLDPAPKNRFLSDFLPVQQRIAYSGFWNSLSQTLLKFTCPGVPDIYQGNELWDLSLVDPDNRRPVDYVHRRQVFDPIRKLGNDPDPDSIEEMLNSPQSGRLKMYLIWRTLCLRKQMSELFQKGDYLPLSAQGTRADHVIGFVRRYENNNLLVVAPRLVATLLGEGAFPPIGATVWDDTEVFLPPFVSNKYRNAFTGETADFPKSEGKILVSRLLAHFPVALWMSEPA